MSRYTFRGNRPTLRIIVGWDRPLCTLFAQVWDEADPDSEHPTHWVGCKFEEVTTAEELESQLAAYGQIPDAILDCLRVDLVEAELEFHLLRSRS